MSRKDKFNELMAVFESYKSKLKNTETKLYINQARQSLECCEFLEDLKDSNNVKPETKTS